MTRSSIIGAKTCLWLALVGSWSPLRAELKPEDLYSGAVPSIVTLDVENTAGRHFVGTAFLAVADGVAVTAWHVIHDAQHVQARYSDGQQVKVMGLVDKNEQLDLALIRLEGPPRPRIKLGSAAPRIGSRIYVLGAPRGFDFSISEGLVSQVRTLDEVRYYQLSCPISPGDSGGPVLNDSGEAVGVVSWRKADAESLAFAIPGAAIAGMDAAREPVAWPSATGALASNANAPAQRKPFAREATAEPLPPPTTDYTAFQQFLTNFAGQRVSVIVQAQGKEKHFDIQVPAHLPH